MAVVTDLVTKFSFVGSLNPLTMFNADMAGSVFIIGEFVKGVTSAAGAIGDFVADQVDATRTMDNLSFVTGVSANKMREWEYAAQQLGAGAGDVTGAIDSLSQKINQAAITGDADFARLGISIRGSNGQLKTADVVMGEVSNRFKTLGLSVQQQRPLADALGIDANLLRFMNESKASIAGLSAEARALNNITKDQTKAAEAYSNATLRSQAALAGLGAELALGFAPSLKESSKWLGDFIAENKEWIVDGLMGAAEWVGNLTDMVGRLAPYLGVVAAGFALVSAASMPINLTVLAIAAGVTALILVVDDLIVAFNGGESVISEFFESMFGWDIGEFMRGMVADFKNGFGQIMEFIQPVIDFFTGGLGVELAKFTENPIAYFTGGGGEGASSVDNRSVNQNIEMNIATSDPGAAAAEAVRSLGAEMKDAELQLNKGGR